MQVLPETTYPSDQLEKKVQLCISSVIPQIATYLRQEVAPLLSDASPIDISFFDMARIKKMIGESIWQSGVPVVASLHPKLTSIPKSSSVALQQ